MLKYLILVIWTASLICAIPRKLPFERFLKETTKNRLLLNFRAVLRLILSFLVQNNFLGPAVEEKDKSVEVCSLPPTSGEIVCSGVFYRWSYNSQTQECEKIVYGGCHGTANLFRNQYACLAKCNQKGKL